MSTPFLGKEFSFKQPDGTYLRVRGSGDEHRAVFETLDGRQVIRDATTGLYQAAAARDGAAGTGTSGARAERDSPRTVALAGGILRVATPRRSYRRKSRWEARRERQKEMLRTPRRAPPQRHTTGDFVGLCLLVQFPDVPGTITPAQVTAFCNKQGYSGFGNKGSVHDYFLDVSAGKLRYTNVVAPYYTARKPRDYYTDESVTWPARAGELIQEALADLKARGFDFSSLTVDAENYVYAVNVLYAGPLVNAWCKGLWPHQSGLPEPFEVAPGKTAMDYQITDMGEALTLGTFCHENGHMICDFPDLYDYGNESYGVGGYCLMCSGGSIDPKNPAQVGAYLKYQSGWATSVQMIAGTMDVALRAGKNDFCIFKKNATEYFLIENRRAAGRDSALDGSGLAVWHVDELGDNSNEAMTPAAHYECALVQADGSFDLERGVNQGDGGDLFSAGVNARFADATSPSSRWWDGSDSGLELTEIGASGATIRFTARQV